MQIIRAHASPIDALTFAPDGRAIAFAAGLEVRIQSLETGEVLQSWPANTGMTPLVFTPDGSRLVHCGNHYGGLYVWPVKGVGQEFVLPDRIENLAVSPDGQTVAATGYMVRRWRIETGKELAGRWGGTRESTNGKRFPAGGIAYTPDGRLLATVFGVLGNGVYNSHVLFWDATSGKLVRELAAPLVHEHPPQIAFSPDGTILAARSGPVLRAWDVASHRELALRKTGTKHLKGMAFTPDGRRLVTVSNDKTARVWDCATWREVGGYEWKIGKLRAVAGAPDGLRVAAGGDSGKIVVWDFED